MSSKLEKTRRQFIKTAMVGSVVAGMAAGSNVFAAETPSNDTVASINEIVWDEEFDVLVVGGGAAGLSAAVTVATEGGDSVLLLEKGASNLGAGNSIFSSGIILSTDDADSMFEYLKELRGGYTGTPDAVLRAFADELAQQRSWLTSLGASEELAVDASGPAEWSELEHSFATQYITFNKKDPNGITHVCMFLDKVLNDHADTVTRLYEAPLTALVQDPQTKRVVGGTYAYEGRTIYVKANKGVVMCCGGFENDPIMKQDYLSFPISHPAAGVCNTGDGHRICAKLGADMWHMNSYAGSWNNAIKLDGSEMAMYRTLKKNQGISVGINGRRYYMDWDGTTMFGEWTGTDMSLNYGCRHGHYNFGGDWTNLAQPETSWFVFDSNGLAKSAYLGSYAATNTMFTQTEVTEAEFTVDPAADGYGYSSDTIEGLAEQMGVPVEEFVGTVERWNTAVANGDDEQFHRPTDTLIPIDTPPFYAVKCCPEVLNTDGGPRRDEFARILDIDGDPIPGLFSAGEFGSVWCDKYQGAGNIGECLAFGRIAARSAMANA